MQVTQAMAQAVERLVAQISAEKRPPNRHERRTLARLARPHERRGPRNLCRRRHVQSA